MKVSSVKVLSNQIEKLSVNADKLIGEIHELALQCLWYASEKGSNQATPAIQLVNALNKGRGKGVRVQALCHWFKVYGQFVENAETKSIMFKARKVKPTEGSAAESYMDKLENGQYQYNVEKAIEQANANPFYELTEEKKPPKTEYDFLEMLVNLEKQMTSRLKKAAEGEARVTHETVKNMVSEMIAKIQGVGAAAPADELDVGKLAEQLGEATH